MDNIKIFTSLTTLFDYAVEDFASRAITAIDKQGTFSVVLSGGNTPTLFFDLLSHDHKNHIPWQKIKFFFGDERYVPANDVKSNYHMAYEHLFSKVPINPQNIYRIPTEFNDPHDAAKEYEKIIRRIIPVNDNQLPQFDLCYLGLGDNAHTASLMPFNDVVKWYIESKSPESQPLVAAVFTSASHLNRITLLPNIINNSQTIIFLV